MNTTLNQKNIQRTLSSARRELLQTFRPEGCWRGELSSSALATATAICALACIDSQKHSHLIGAGLAWLRKHRNHDGGWGDTIYSQSNISTTILCWAALDFCQTTPAPDNDFVITQAENWLKINAGGLTPYLLANAVMDRYGKDKTFSAPILSMCALTGKLGPKKQAWRWVSPLPFELAALPHRWYHRLRLQVVSYALPALIAIGQARFQNRPPLNPLSRLIRKLLRRKTLAILPKIQPSSGGFLEATPLTGFVVMNLTAAGQKEHSVCRKGIEFIIRSQRDDGSWPIDTNLAIWVTTQAVNALALNPDFAQELSTAQRNRIQTWIIEQQVKQVHPYTHADPGGWGWTCCSGSVPDADDTAGALLALHHLQPIDTQSQSTAVAGVRWLLQLQNKDGGIPTFCKGWTDLPFDRSGTDLTAHALLAWNTWKKEFPRDLQKKIDTATSKALQFLQQNQKPNGSWIPLWFGNETNPAQDNPTYGTARVLLALTELHLDTNPRLSTMIPSAIDWFLSNQNPQHGWGNSIEETALAVAALSKAHCSCPSTKLTTAINSGISHLIEQTRQGSHFPPAPIGFYFAKLWYFEKLYPVIFTTMALEQAQLSGILP